jgi:hypothetical protein
VLFWAPWNATVRWGGARYLGPFYFLAVLVPMGLLGARSLAALGRESRATLAWVAGAMVIVNLAVCVFVAGHHLRFTRQQQAVASLVSRAAGPSIVFTRLPAPFLQHPVAALGNGVRPAGKVVYAVQQGAADLDAFRMFPDRQPFVLTASGDFTEKRGVTGSIQRLAHVTAPRVELRVTVRVPKGSWVTALEVRAFGRARQYTLPYSHGTHVERLSVSATGVRLAAGKLLDEYTPRRPRVFPDSAPVDRGLVLTLFLAKHTRVPRFEPYGGERIAIRRAGGLVEALVPVGAVTSTPGVGRRVVVVTAA